MDNKALAIKRADNLKNRLGKNPSLESGYDAVLQDLEEKGIVYEVPVEELTSECPVFHPPHRPVVREASTRTKIRPVFDAPVKGLNGVAFDDGMEAGPNLIPSLIERMLSFGILEWLGNTKNMYANGWLSGADTEEDIENMITLATEIMNKGGFPLSKWGSNSVPVPQADVI
ncbi:hypothetical protein RRG08_060452 [Elysia crispata]|uniref:Uncharacterized protein n=1 Tax=Elysia crispata TaxID=231223 RepID=A0AAE1AZS2_9GAST|nr:hypothetical protein RRG08_060452 [Elysia crispata]